MTNRRPRAVIDTNVWVSAYRNPAGAPARVIDIWRDSGIVLCVSEVILAEYRHVFARFAQAFDISIDDEIAAMERRGFMCHPPLLPGCVPGDADDEKFLECAVAASADYVISGDGRLLAQSGYRGIAVVAPGDFARGFS